MKYFLDCDTMILYSVPKKYHVILDIINRSDVGDDDINAAKEIIIKTCKMKLRVHALTQTL